MTKRMNVCKVMYGNGDTPRSFLGDGDLEDGFGSNLQLLPGIHDEITVNHIATKIHWKDVYNLSSVSRLWNETIRSRVIFQARSSSQSTQTLFAFQGHMKNEISKIWDDEFMRESYPQREFFLYSPKDDSCYQLPPNPDIDIQPSDLGCECECVFLEGKLYVLGGASRSSKLDRTNVFVYDLVGQKGWKACAPMQPRMIHFQCAIISGKIYAFNGIKVHWWEDFRQIKYDMEETFGYTVYDPEQDSWSPLTFDSYSLNNYSPYYIRLHQRMIPVGEKLVVYNGPCGEMDPDDPTWEYSAGIYSPTTGEWKIMEEFRLHYADLIIKVDDKVYRLYRFRTDKFDYDTDIDYLDMFFCDGAVVDDVLYLLESRAAFNNLEQDGFNEHHGQDEDWDDDRFRTDEVVLIAISGWKEHASFEVDTREEIEIIDTMITEHRETDCCLPKDVRVRGLFRCPVRL